jgi:maltooligosyltrehalose trehalohydrolase
VTVFEVWAPDHDRIELVLGDRRVPMTPVDPGSSSPGALAAHREGWWAAEVDDAGAGTHYRYSVDGGPPRPDPRSRWQPEGIDGPSAVVDHAAFAWTDGAWTGRRLASSVLYEMHIGTFSPEATFDGAIDHLDHLVDLGVDAIEILPVAEFGGDRGWGYDGVLLWAPHHAYGGPDGFKRLVDAAHARGIAVVLDVVYNHLGPAGNYLGEYGPYFTDRYATPWGSAINVDGDGSDEVRRFIMDNACAWLDDYHVDGLRLDAVHAIIDQSALHLLEEMAGRVGALEDRLGRTKWLIAESDRNDPRLVASTEAGGWGLDATWSDDFHHALHSALSGDRDGYYVDYGSLALLARTLRHVYAYGRDWSPFRRRHHGRPAGDLPGTRFLGYAQNHDQIGNRAVGERLAALVSPGRLKIAAALVLTAPFVPMLFQGEEWAASTPWIYFTDHRDPDLGRAVSDGRRREFGAFGWAPDDVPDPQDPESWRRSLLDWDEVHEGGHAEMLAWHRTLLQLRRTVGDLSDGRRQSIVVSSSEEEQWLRMDRGAVTVVCNLSGDERSFAMDGTVLLAGSEAGVALGPSGAGGVVAGAGGVVAGAGGVVSGAGGVVAGASGPVAGAGGVGAGASGAVSGAGGGTLVLPADSVAVVGPAAGGA